MKSNRAYWLCQVFGWGGYSLAGAIGSGPTSDVAIGYALYFVYSIALTHALRGYIHRRGWLDGSAPEGLRHARCYEAAWIVGWIQAALVIGINFLLTRGQSPFLKPGIVIPAALGITAAPLGWMTLYLAITSTRRSRENQLALRNAELRALELQINPHFLFNSLNSIRGLVVENPPLAQDLITRFANILRYNLHRDAAHTVPLASELEAASDYLAIEAARFEDRLRIHYDIAPASRTLEVPPMLVQTLVENAVKHGISKLPEGGDLHVSSALEDGALVLRVVNPGRLDEDTRKPAGLGLQNLRDRLRILYGPAGKLDLYGHNGVVTATVRIPIRP